MDTFLPLTLAIDCQSYCYAMTVLSCKDRYSCTMTTKTKSQYRYHVKALRIYLHSTARTVISFWVWPPRLYIGLLF